MKSVPRHNFLVLFITMLLNFCETSSLPSEKPFRGGEKNYIVQMLKENMPKGFTDHPQWYRASLKSVSESANMFYTYNEVFHGFSARLTAEEAELLERKPGVLRVYPEKKYELLTTRSPQFLGLLGSEALLPSFLDVSNVIIAVLDSGVWPESQSFNDLKLPPVPEKWKGTCAATRDFNSSSCNRKLVGARAFLMGKQDVSPRDGNGHGTHTASTAAGSQVTKANLFGFANGTARGMAQSARVAVYKTCYSDGCSNIDILAAMDQAVIDGVDIISMSLGGPFLNYEDDVTVIGAFAATQKGVFVSCSAGNDGPRNQSITNSAPWIATVGASTLDRDFPAKITLGNRKSFSGVSLSNEAATSSRLVYGGSVNKSANGSFCGGDSLKAEDVRGKIVLCDRGGTPRTEKGFVVLEAGGLGMILANRAVDGNDIFADGHPLPAIAVSYTSGVEIKEYISKTGSKAAATIHGAHTEVGIQPAPIVAGFSSRGPSLIAPAIVKPDFVAPGVNILAAWPENRGPTGSPRDKRNVKFNIMSGTSMSCPHVSGLAALLKAAHPQWSPAIIKSALMTTAYTAYIATGRPVLDRATGRAATAFALGAGHVDPVAALNPGLAYEITTADYENFLCALKYNASAIRAITRTNFSCKAGKKYRVEDLNYPSFGVLLRSRASITTVTYARTVTNVGCKGAIYNVSIKAPQGVQILVEPGFLNFSKQYEKRSYSVTFKSELSMPLGTVLPASLEWVDGTHVVRSQIALFWI